MLRLPIVLTAATVCAAGLTGCGTSTATPEGPTRITVSVEHCGAGWSDPHAGQQTFVLTNRDIVSGEVFLTDAKTGAVYAYVDNIAPNASANLRIDLGSDEYAFRCAMSDRNVARGSTVTVPGHAKGGRPPVMAVSQNDLIPVALGYQSYVDAELPVLADLVTTLDADLRSGALAKARGDWLAAHLAYERLGAAYGAFGDSDTAVNGTTSGLPGGVDDPGFTGFHRIEYGLWHDQGAAELTSYGDRLVSDVAAMTSAFASAQIDPLDIAIRAHEITENALQFELTGRTDYGSGTNLATVDANLDGTKEVLDLLRPVIASRYPELSEVDTAIARAERDIGAAKDVDATDASGSWTPLAGLSTAQRERIDADISGLSELLAPIATICEPRRTS